MDEAIRKARPAICVMVVALVCLIGASVQLIASTTPTVAPEGGAHGCANDNMTSCRLWAEDNCPNGYAYVALYAGQCAAACRTNWIYQLFHPRERIIWIHAEACS